MRLCVQLMSTLQGQAGQDFGMQAFGGMPGERRPNMLASIQTYLDKLQEIMQNPSVLLPSLSYPPGQGLHLLTVIGGNHTCITYLQSQMLHDLCIDMTHWPSGCNHPFLLLIVCGLTGWGDDLARIVP